MIDGTITVKIENSAPKKPLSAKEALEKQLQLLSERSEKVTSPNDLATLSLAMCEVTDRLSESPLM